MIRRWTARFAVSRSMVLVLLLILPAATSAAEPDPPNAAVDSTALAIYLELPGKTLKEHRKQAEQLLEQAEKEADGMARLGLLQEATLIDPAGIANWLALADRQLVMGHDAGAEVSLAAARVCLKFLKGDERKKAIGDYSMAMGWWHYRRGEWQKGQDWARRTLKADVGLDAHLLLHLNRARIFRSRHQYDEEMAVFMPYWQDWRRMGHYDWCKVMFTFFHYEEYDGPYMADRLEKKAPNRYVQEPLRWRDHGLYCEAHEAEDMALLYYGMSAEAVLSQDGGWLRRNEHKIPVRKNEMSPMPFWVNPDGGYVTGSLLAYLGNLRDEMVASNDATQKDILAERILAYYERTANRYDLYPWPILWRTEALFELDQIKEAGSEIRTAKDTFKNLKVEDPAVDRLQGRILVVQKKFGHAAKLLCQAVVDFPDDATCWSDLGIAEAMVGDKVRAREAFDRALALDRDLAAAWYNRGLLRMKQGDLSSALADLERAVELVPENDEIRSDLVKLGQKAAAERAGR